MSDVSVATLLTEGQSHVCATATVERTTTEPVDVTLCIEHITPDDAGPSGVRIAVASRVTGWPLVTLDLPDATSDALCDVLANMRAQRGAR